MALPAPPFPPSGRFIEYVRGSSRALTQGEAVTVSVRPSANDFQISPSVPVGNSELFCNAYHAWRSQMTDLRINSIPATLPSFQNRAFNQGL